MPGFISLAIFLFLAIALTVPGGYSLGAAMLLLGSAALLRQPPDLDLKRDDYTLIGVFVLYFVVYTANNIFHADPLREYDAPLRFLLAVPVLLSLLAYPAKPAALWGGLACGAIGAGVFIGWQHEVEGIGRPGGNTNPIQFGNISMLLGIFCLCGLAWAQTRPRRAAWTVLLAVGAILGVYGSILTGSRGGWFALPICAGIVAAHFIGIERKRYLYAGLLALAALLAALYAAPQSSIRERSELAAQELQDYFKNGKEDSSVGQRLEMWRSAIAMLPGHVWLGWGKQGYMARKIELIREGKIAPEIAEYTNAHNDYLDALVKHGIGGLLALLALYLAPLLLFARHLKDPDREVHPYALAGVCMSISYILFGLTTTFMTLNIGVMMFAFPTVILWSSMRNHQRAALSVKG